MSHGFVGMQCPGCGNTVPFKKVRPFDNGLEYLVPDCPDCPVPAADETGYGEHTSLSSLQRFLRRRDGRREP